MNGKIIQKQIDAGVPLIQLSDGLINVEEPLVVRGDCQHIIGRGMYDYRIRNPRGTQLKARFGGAPVLIMGDDKPGDEGCTQAVLSGFTIFSGREKNPPTCAIHLSRNPASNWHTFTRVGFWGHYAHACAVSIASESNTWNSCRFAQWRRGQPAFYTGSWDRFAGEKVGLHGAATNEYCGMQRCAFSIPEVTGDEGPDACVIWLDWPTKAWVIKDPYVSCKSHPRYAAAQIPCVVRVGNTDGQKRYSPGLGQVRVNGCEGIVINNPTCDGDRPGYERFIEREGE